MLQYTLHPSVSSKNEAGFHPVKVLIYVKKFHVKEFQVKKFYVKKSYVKKSEIEISE